jgi:agmatinase
LENTHITIGKILGEYEELSHNTIATVPDKEIRNGNGVKLLKDITSTFDRVYLSVDLDVLDPAFAPGVGNPEAIGISSRELYDLIITLQNKKIVASDIVELNPTYDNGSTASIAAKMIVTIIAMNLSR